MGLEIKRSDTPEFIQDFLEELLVDCLNGLGEDHIIERIKEFKTYFKDLDPWGKGMPKRANNVTLYTARMLEKATAPQTNTLHKLITHKKIN